PQRTQRAAEVFPMWPLLFIHPLSEDQLLTVSPMPQSRDRHNVKRPSVLVLPLRSFVASVVGSSLVLVLLMATMFGCMGGEPKHATWKNATGAEQYERLLWQALRDKDWKEAEYRLAPTFVGVIASGQALDRAGWIAHWQAAQIKEFSLGEVSVQPNGPDMTVAYQLHQV